jgi:hypothetical protein
MQYLEDEQTYIDRYDLHTIKECLDWEKRVSETNIPEYNGKKLSKKNQKPFKKFFTDFPLYFRQGERYKNKKGKIQEWMNRDRQLDEKYENTPEPQKIYCTSCRGKMIATSKELYDFTNEPLKVLFFFDCPSCKKRRGIFDTGEEFRAHENLCPQCKYPVEVSLKSKSNKVTIWTTRCSHCGFKKQEIDDFSKWEKERANEEKENAELLRKYRAVYCFSDKEGQEYIEQTIRLNNVTELMNEHDRKNSDPAYQKAKQLKILAVLELEKLLSEVLEKDKYVKLTFDKPEMDKYVIIPFTTQDSDASRKEYDSTHSLQKIINNALEETNWRLMSEGTTYRLGYVYGRIKGYEREEDLANLFRKT